MAKSGKNRNYKIYSFNSVEEALGVLGQLIMNTSVHLEKYTAYRAELAELILAYSDGGESRPVPEGVYHSLNDRIMYRQMMLLRELADEQGASFSYKNLRRFLKKQGYLKGEPAAEVSRILNELLEIRNWTFHNPQSLFTAGREVAERSIPDAVRSMVTMKPQLNPVFVQVHDFYDVTWLISLSLHMERREGMFQRVLDAMKEDYREMYRTIRPGGLTYFNGELIDNREPQFRICHVQTPKGLMDSADMTAQISMAIQKGEYDGSSEVFDKWTLGCLGGRKDP